MLASVLLEEKGQVREPHLFRMIYSHQSCKIKPFKEGIDHFDLVFFEFLGGVDHLWTPEKSAREERYFLSHE